MNESILLVDDDRGAIKLMANILADIADLRFASTGDEALRLARESTPDLILLDAQMPSMSGFLVFDVLKADPQLADIPVIFVTSHSESAFEVSALQMGAADFIAKPVNPALVRARVKTHLRIKGLTDELRRTSTVDRTTGVANRLQFEESLNREWLRARRSGDPMGLLMIDLDHFKLYNERYGRVKGDVCLQRVAQALTMVARHPADLVARSGGGEFVVLLPSTPRRGADHVAGRVIAAVNALGISHGTSPTASHVTVSVGVASYDEESPHWVDLPQDHRSLDTILMACTADELLLTAERALGLARRSGRAQSFILDIGEAKRSPRSHETDLTDDGMRPSVAARA